jgi:hypothetical protein
VNTFRAILVTAAIALLTTTGFAGDLPPVHLTGNSAVDFFGTVPMQPAVTSGALPAAQENSVMANPGAEEKSPWIAGLLSLAVPGAGEVYSKSYVKGAVFFAAEAGSWIMYAVYTKKGNDQKAEYMAYADAHYSPVRYAQWLKNYINAKSGDTTGFAQLFRTNPPNLNDGPPFGDVNWADLNSIESALGATQPGITHQLPYYGEQQYWELIGKYIQFIKGWDTEDYTDPTLPEVQDRYLPQHAQFYQYGEMFNQADTYYNTASSFLSVIIVNHLLSAADAFWTASRLNNSLHADVRMNLEPTPMGMVPVTKARVEFRF